MHATRSRSSLTRAAACIGLLATAAAVHAQPLELYVDDDAPNGGDGLSWGTAMNSLDDALEIVRAHFEAGPTGNRVVRVAQGVYVPGGGNSSRDATFSVLSSTILEGGYAGIGAANPDEQDPGRFVTVLSGDCNRDDLPGFLNRSDNVYHVVTFENDGATGQITGFSVRGGQADGGGSRNRGGGVTAVDGIGHAFIVSCRIEDNVAVFGGGVGALTGLVVLYECDLIGNAALHSGGAAWFGFEGEVLSSRVKSNSVGLDSSGGGVVLQGSSLKVSLSEFTANQTAGSGGAIAIWNGAAEISNCTFNANIAVVGAGIWSASSDNSLVVNSVLAYGNASEQPLLHRSGLGAFDVGYSIVEGGVPQSMLLSAGSFAFSTIVNAAPRFVDPLGLDGIAGTNDDDLRLEQSSCAIDAGLAIDPWYYEHSLPWAVDLAGAPRFHDDPAMPNIGEGWRTDVDIGAYEFQGTSCRADQDGSGGVSVPDIFSYLSDWFAQRPEADFDRDRNVEVDDLFQWLAAWFAGCD